MTSTTEVVSKNNLAVAAIAQGCQRETARMMRHTLLKLNELYAHQEKEDEATMDMELEEEEEEEESPRAKKRRALLSSSSPLRSVAVCKANCSDEAFPSMFLRAMILAPEEQNVPVIAAVVLFNLALSEHLLGATYNNSKKIASAHRFYNLSYQIIEESKDKCVFDDLLVLAVINNLGETCSQLCNSKRSRAWFRCLAHILGVTTSNNGRCLPSIDEDDYMFFYLNAMLQQGQMLSAAPAA